MTSMLFSECQHLCGTAHIIYRLHCDIKASELAKMLLLFQKTRSKVQKFELKKNHFILGAMTNKKPISYGSVILRLT